MIAHRELYCPAHFGNHYEVMGEREMRALLEEARWWGFTAYSDWFDTADLKNPAANPRGEYLLPQALWERKVAAFRAAQQEGLAASLLTTPNHVFLDQLRPGLLAHAGDRRIFGQLLCPSRPEAREIILQNHRDLFSRLQQAGVRLAALSACPYDYGGCDCDRCSPWILTFGRLLLDLHREGQRFFPNLELRLVGWWWDRQEHETFRAWAEREAPGRFRSLALHIPYNAACPEVQHPLSEGCERHIFAHIGYPETNVGGDLYGPWGPVVAPTRLAATVAALQAAGGTGFMAYSEGGFDDVNKALLAGLASGAYASPQQVLAAYAARYFGAGKAAAADWAAWLSQWGRPFAVAPGPARKEFDRLARDAKPGWRLAQWEHKVALFSAHAAVKAGKRWNAARLAQAERFFAVRERMQRTVWGLGPVRHVLNERYHQPDWHVDWRRALDPAGGAAAADPEA